jgi:tRNA nucleotidyltransferase (CCA-adding enzyme)
LFEAQIPSAVAAVLSRLVEAKFETFLVGGCVRDLLRGQTPKDFDLATAARPEDVQRVFRRVLPTGIAHGTVTVVEKGAHVEVTTFRSEGDYLDGRRPSTVSFHTDIEADLSRRDFTINAMAWCPGRPLVDPFDGQTDLALNLVRCVRNPRERFEEDGLRALRAVRFATVLGFEIDPPTEAAIRPTLPVFRKVALERVKEELVKIVASRRARVGVELLHRTGLLEACWPEARAENAKALSHCPERLDVRLAVLLWAIEKPRDVLLRLKFSNGEAAAAAALVEQPVWPAKLDNDAALRRYLAALGATPLEAVIATREALGLEREVAPRLSAIAAANPALTAKHLALDGKEIMAILGVGPSPLVGEATRWLVGVVLDDPSVNTPAALTQCLRQWRQGDFPQVSHTNVREN